MNDRSKFWALFASCLLHGVIVFLCASSLHNLHGAKQSVSTNRLYVSLAPGLGHVLSKTPERLREQRSQGLAVQSASDLGDKESGAVVAMQNGTGDEQEVELYLNQVRNMISTHLLTPNALRPRRRGDLVAQIKIEERGKISEAKVVKSSGSEGLDQFTINTIKNITNLPAWPDSLRTRIFLEVQIPIFYRTL